MEDKIQQLEAQVAKLTNRISELENDHKNTHAKFTNIQKHFNTMEENLNTVNNRQDRYDEIVQKLTDNLTILSETVINNTKMPRTSKRSSPYEKTSYEQTKKIHNLRSNKQKRASADDSETTPATDDDMAYQDQSQLTDNALYDGIIEPNSDYGQKNDNNPNSTFASYNIFAGFSSHK